LEFLIKSKSAVDPLKCDEKKKTIETRNRKNNLENIHTLNK